MKKCQRFLITAFFTLGVFIAVQSQDPQFSQYYSNPIYLNPALAGNVICPRLKINYRNQWPSIPSNFITYSASYDQYIHAMRGAIGVLVISDQAGGGTLQNNSFSAIYSYRLQISDELLVNAGFQASYMQIGLNWDKLVFADELEHGQTQEKQPSDLTKGFPDFSAGILMGYKESVYMGLAAHHVSQPNYDFMGDASNYLPVKFTIHAGALFNLLPHVVFYDDKRLFSISPNVLYHHQQEFKQLNLGVYLNIWPFTTGLWFRHNFDRRPDAIIALLGIEHKKLKIGYSYDYTVSQLTNATGGAHEISLTYRFSCSAVTEVVRAINWPTF